MLLKFIKHYELQPIIFLLADIQPCHPLFL